MSKNEFAIIDSFFKRKRPARAEVVLGIGDDAAILTIPSTEQIVMTIDTMVEGVHFDASVAPQDLGYKLVAVNLSDLAAMGARPIAVLLALTLPQADETWLQAFSAGMFELLDQFNCQLIGGDLTQGKLTCSLQATGLVAAGTALTRQDAQVDDLIYVSGELGIAALGLAITQQKITLPLDQQTFFLQHLHRPTPRVALGLALVGLANSAIDISDGLVADLDHLLQQSSVGAMLYAKTFPFRHLTSHVPESQALALALYGGDDYELCFTVPPHNTVLLEQTFAAVPGAVHCIGKITAQPGIQLQYGTGVMEQLVPRGYQHF